VLKSPSFVTKRDARIVAMITVKQFLEETDNLDKVAFVLYSEYDFNIYVEKAREVFET
jgi:aspartokinase-like uncharacterized kinase